MSVLGEPPTPRMLTSPVPLLDMPYPITPRRVTKAAGESSSTASKTVRAPVRLISSDVVTDSLGTSSGVTTMLTVVCTVPGASWYS